MADKAVKTNINYPIRENVNIGEVRISDDVVVMISALAATEVEEVASLAGNITKSAVPKTSNGKLSKAIKIKVANGEVYLNVSINVKDGCDIPETCRSVQTKIKSAIETMTGLKVATVNVRVQSIALNMEKA